MVLRETGPHGKWGVATTHDRKMAFVAVVEQLMLENALTISAAVVSDDATAALATLRQQMGAFRKINSELGKSTAFANPKIIYSGKVNAEGKMMPNALQDDLCITLQLLAFWSKYVVQRKCKFLDYESIFGSK